MKLAGHERILVIKPSSLGDVVHTLPAVAAIRRHCPEARIDWLVNTEWRPLLEGSPAVDRVLPFPRREFRGIGGLLAARKWARAAFAGTDYDCALDFQGLLRSALLARLSGARERIGFSHAREGASLFYGESIVAPDWRRLHAVDRYRKMVEALGVPTEPVEFPLPPGETPDLAEPLPERPIVLHPFSRGVGKSLSPEEVRELCEGLAPHPVVLVGRTQDETATIDWPANVVDLLDRTSLAELIHILRRADWTLSVDSGPMHLAAGISDRVLSLHTWTDPAMVGPWRSDAWIWRDGHIVRVGDLVPGRFPEERGRKRAFDRRERLLAPADRDEIIRFLLSRRPA